MQRLPTTAASTNGVIHPQSPGPPQPAAQADLGHAGYGHGLAIPWAAQTTGEQCVGKGLLPISSDGGAPSFYAARAMTTTTPLVGVNTVAHEIITADTAHWDAVQAQLQRERDDQLTRQRLWEEAEAEQRLREEEQLMLREAVDVRVREDAAERLKEEERRRRQEAERLRQREEQLRREYDAEQCRILEAIKPRAVVCRKDRETAALDAFNTAAVIAPGSIDSAAAVAPGSFASALSTPIDNVSFNSATREDPGRIHSTAFDAPEDSSFSSVNSLWDSAPTFIPANNTSHATPPQTFTRRLSTPPTVPARTPHSAAATHPMVVTRPAVIARPNPSVGERLNATLHSAKTMFTGK